MEYRDLPLAYRWFLARGLRDLRPWYFVDAPGRLSTADELRFATRQFELETAADFEVRLFARRQDMDDFAFFVVRDGIIEDRVISTHLTFARGFDRPSPFRYAALPDLRFMRWLGEEVLTDIDEWMSEEDLQ
jgi:hypothetical protein